MLCIDLNMMVVEQAKELGIKMIVVYHPVIFNPIKRINDPVLVECIKNCISIFCPHTGLDGRMNAYIKKQLIGLTMTEAIKKLTILSKPHPIRIVRNEKITSGDKDHLLVDIYEEELEFCDQKLNSENFIVGVGAAFKKIYF